MATIDPGLGGSEGPSSGKEGDSYGRALYCESLNKQEVNLNSREAFS